MRTLLVTATAIGLAASVAFAEDAHGPVPKPEVNEALAELGKRLFFDVRLSGDMSMSCATCHVPDQGFASDEALSTAYTGSEGFRNTPTLINAAQRAVWFHDGRLGTNLNDVTREMLTETYMMNMDMRIMQERLKQDPVYVELFEAAGKGEPSNGGVRNAIPEYLKTLVSTGSDFDEGDMSRSARRGFALFTGKANCVACHTGERFTDDKLHVTGAPENPDIWSDPMRHHTWVAFAKFQGIQNYMNLREDVGGHIVAKTADGAMKRSFVTPTLRELTYTAPYMHNGMLETLEDVVAFYDQGGGDLPNKSELLQPLNLSDREKDDLVAFLEALSGDPLTSAAHVWEDEIDTFPEPFANWREIKN